MPILPDSRIERVEFFEAHDPIWTSASAGDPPAIGLTPAQCLEMTALTTTARAKYNAMLSARQASKAATAAFYNAEDAMAQNGAGLIATIKAYAETTADPNVYVLAQIPAPAVPVPAGAPTNPTALGAFLENDGSVTLSWKGTLAKGQYFSVWRQLHGSTEWTSVGTVAAKKFTDNNVPSAIISATYQVKAHRNTQVSAGSEPVTVLFGSQLAAA